MLVCCHYGYVVSNLGYGKVTIMFQYLPFFNVTCATITDLQPEGLSESQLSFFADKSMFLHCLYDKDTGRTSPNTVVSQLIRKYGGDTFSSAVRQYGFPYRWVQRVCGAGSLSEGADDPELKPDYELSVQSIVSLVDVLKKRMKSQVQLVKELSALGLLFIIVYFHNFLLCRSKESRF